MHRSPVRRHRASKASRSPRFAWSTSSACTHPSGPLGFRVASTVGAIGLESLEAAYRFNLARATAAQLPIVTGCDLRGRSAPGSVSTFTWCQFGSLPGHPAVDNSHVMTVNQEPFVLRGRHPHAAALDCPATM